MPGREPANIPTYQRTNVAIDRHRGQRDGRVFGRPQPAQRVGIDLLTVRTAKGAVKNEDLVVMDNRSRRAPSVTPARASNPCWLDPSITPRESRGLFPFANCLKARKHAEISPKSFRLWTVDLGHAGLDRLLMAVCRAPTMSAPSPLRSFSSASFWISRRQVSRSNCSSLIASSNGPSCRFMLASTNNR